MRKQVLLGMMMFAMGASLIGCGKSENNVETNTPTVVNESMLLINLQRKRQKLRQIHRLGIRAVLEQKVA